MAPSTPLSALLALLAAAASVAPAARAQLPNIRIGLPPDTDENKRLDVQSGYSLVVRPRTFTAHWVPLLCQFPRCRQP
jgi:hypothetical protein